VSLEQVEGEARRDTAVCVAPDLPVSLFFFDVVYHINLLAFVAWGEAMVAEI